MTLLCPAACRGSCCRHAVHMQHLLSPGWPINPDGSCGHLTPDGRCGIYDRRPTVCRVEDGRPPGVAVDAWFTANADACASIQADAGLDPSTLRPGFNP